MPLRGCHNDPPQSRLLQKHSKNTHTRSSTSFDTSRPAGEDTTNASRCGRLGQRNFFDPARVELLIGGSPTAIAVNDDAQLIRQTLAGQAAAFGELVSKYQDRLYTTFAHMAGSTDDARDIVQDAFVQAFVKLETFRGSSAFYTWLYRIAFNVWVSRKRRQRPVLSIDRTRDLSGEEPIDGASPEDRLIGQERAVQVRRALAALSEEHRSILVLREIEGFDYEQIADTLDVPVGTVRSRLHRARLQLRDLLVEVVQEDAK
jgi:RNA polymerase sigma-70 factor (ECF subfamily)